jgi:hypothetical protein
MELITNKEACNSCNMRCNASKDCCCSCEKKCVGRTVCPIFNYSPPPIKKRKPRPTKAMKLQKMFDDLMNKHDDK